MPDAQRPQKVRRDSVHGDTYQHLAFGSISVNTPYDGGMRLYGSELTHDNCLELTISTAELHRDLSRDWHAAGRQIVKVRMSAAQWAELRGGGHGCERECTLTWLKGEGPLPNIEPLNTVDQFRDAHEAMLEHAKALLSQARALLVEKKATAADRREAVSAIDEAAQEIGVNEQFIRDQFEEHIERNISRARTEIDAKLHQERLRLADVVSDHEPGVDS